MKLLILLSVLLSVCVKDVQRGRQDSYSPPPGTLPSCDRGSQGVTASSVGQSMSGTGGGGTFIPVEDDVSLRSLTL